MRAWFTSVCPLLILLPCLCSTSTHAFLPCDQNSAHVTGLERSFRHLNRSAAAFSPSSLILRQHKTSTLHLRTSCQQQPLRARALAVNQDKNSQHHLNPKQFRGRATLRASRDVDATRNDLPPGLIERRIKIADVELTVVEFDRTTDILDAWIENQMTTVDPFGVVLWPAAQVLAETLYAEDLSGKTVLELGAGTEGTFDTKGGLLVRGAGLCSVAAAKRGALVTATDTNPATLELLELAAARQGVSVQTGLLDITAPADQIPLGFDVLVGADCLYNKQIAKGLARIADRAHELGVRVLIADSVNIARDEFENELRRLGQRYDVQLSPLSFTGSAVGADMDVTRNVSVAVFKLLGRTSSSSSSS